MLDAAHSPAEVLLSLSLCEGDNNVIGKSLGALLCVHDSCIAHAHGWNHGNGESNRQSWSDSRNNDILHDDDGRVFIMHEFERASCTHDSVRSYLYDTAPTCRRGLRRFALMRVLETR